MKRLVREADVELDLGGQFAGILDLDPLLSEGMLAFVDVPDLPLRAGARHRP